MTTPAPTPALAHRRVAVLYDCFFPLTIGGAERWYRTLSETLVAEGASVTYLTRRQWTGDAPVLAGIDLVAVSGAGALYDEHGTRRIAPALAFGEGVFRYLVRHRRAVDVVHVASFPFFSLLAARLALLGSGVPIVVDYHEVWPARFWRSYAGPVAGTVGALIQRLCIALTTHTLVFTPLSAQRLADLGLRHRAQVLPGLLPEVHGDASAPTSPPQPPLVLFVGRAIADKGLGDLAAVFALAAKSVAGLTMEIISDGPERPRLEVMIREHHLDDVVTLRSRVSDEELHDALARASCLLMPSRREGYGIVVVEAAAHATPSVIAHFPENLATHLITDGVNGYVTDPTPEAMAEGVVRAVTAGQVLRDSTVAWFEREAPRRRMSDSARAVVELYQRLLAR